MKSKDQIIKELREDMEKALQDAFYLEIIAAIYCFMVGFLLGTLCFPLLERLL